MMMHFRELVEQDWALDPLRLQGHLDEFYRNPEKLVVEIIDWPWEPLTYLKRLLDIELAIEKSDRKRHTQETDYWRGRIEACVAVVIGEVDAAFEQTRGNISPFLLELWEMTDDS